jgi:Opacity family porin protein
MNRTHLISLTTVVLAAVMASSVNAQEKPSTDKQYSIGPVLEFGGGGTSFGLQGKIGVSPQFSIRPTILFGYKPSVSKSDIRKVYVDTIGQFATNQGLSPSAVQFILDQPVTQVNADAAAEAISGTIGSGTAYGLAATYDFKSPDSKISGYVGPRIMFASASGSVSGFNTTTTETSIGLTAGADYAIAQDFTAGLSATYDFSRSGTFNVTSSAGTGSIPLSGGNFKIGINAGYSF